jgi:hypothetical protein
MVLAATGRASVPSKRAIVQRFIVVIPRNRFSLPDLRHRASKRGQKKDGAGPSFLIKLGTAAQL